MAQGMSVKVQLADAVPVRRLLKAVQDVLDAFPYQENPAEPLTVAVKDLRFAMATLRARGQQR